MSGIVCRPAMISSGLDIYENEALTITEEDWSEVRAPSRAIRRRKRGFAQRIKFVVKPDPKAYRVGNRLFMHPAVLRMFREVLRDRNDREMDRLFLGALVGKPI